MTRKISELSEEQIIKNRQCALNSYYKNKEVCKLRHYKWINDLRLNHPDKYRARIDKANKHTKQILLEIKSKCFTMLGNKCCKCGFSDIRALQINHINGNGRKHRNSVNSVTFYRSIIKSLNENKHEFQILCANCNWIKRVEIPEEHKQHPKKEIFTVVNSK
jgi:hypothetical protein